LSKQSDDAKSFEAALAEISDEHSFIQKLLIDRLNWPIDEKVKSLGDIAYDWDKEELRAKGLERKVVDGRIRQLVLEGCPWGIFLVEFKNPDVFSSGRGMTVPLRQILSGLVPKQRKSANLPSFFRQHLLFICTHDYRSFRFVHFKDPGEAFKQPTLASFGWWPGDSVKTVSAYNLPHLRYLADSATVDDWLADWTAAFDVERVTKRFYEDYKAIHALFSGDQLKGVADATERAWLASVLLNRLMFVYFLQKKGFLDGGDESYLEKKLAASKIAGKDRFYNDFLTGLFFEGFARPEDKRSAAAIKKLGSIRYLNGGLFLPHRIEQDAAKTGKTITLPDSVFAELFKLFAGFSWNLNDKPGGQDNEINPDVLGYIVEKYINQKAFGAYYTRPEITGYLCERTIHRLILDAINTPAALLSPSPGTPGEGRGEGLQGLLSKAGLPIRCYKTVGEMLKKLDDATATKLLDQVLPGLSLLDPACGSGAFLVAAMKTLIDIYSFIFGWIKFNGSAELKNRLKKIDTDHPSLDYFIKKRIITDNLFGVDIMEEAVEIARLRLFLALAAGANQAAELEPLPNIDFNILRGNSLIGLLNVDPSGFDQKNLFLPPYAKVLADRNRELDIYRHTGSYADDLTAQRDRIADVNTKAQDTLDEMLLADFANLGIKYEQATWDDAKGAEGKPKKRPLAIADMQALHPFHWAFAFDKVMARGGFDAIITNPPWEIVKPNGKEFFEEYSDLVTKKSMSIHDFQEEQGKLLKDKDIRPAWLDYLSGYPHQSAYFRSAPEYAHQIGTMNGKKVGSDLNLYKLFTERCFRLLRDGGQCGIVIPSGIYTDLGAKQLRIMLFEQGTIDSLFCIENRRGVFEDVHRMFKFVVLTFARGGHTATFPAAFMRHDVGELERFPAEGALPISVDLVRKLSPDSLSVMEFKQPIDVQIAQKMLRFPLLGEDVPGKWKLSLTAEFHMTNDSDLFHTAPAPGRLSLYEGKMIWHFDHRLAEPKYWVSEKDARRSLGLTPKASVEADYESYRFGVRAVASNTNVRTLIASVVPARMFCGNSLLTTRDHGLDELETLGLVSIVDSLLVDWLLRQKVTTNINMFFIYQLPVPRLTPRDSATFTALTKRAARLICTTPEFDDLAKSVGLNPPNHKAGVTDPAGRAKLRAELDAMVAHLYRLTEEEFSHILSTFPLVAEEVKAAALAEFIRLRDNGQAATFNPDLSAPSPAVATMVDPALAVRAMIQAGESATVEFKSSARWDVKNSKAEKFIERIIVKTIAAFLNTQGGTLVIGVEDDGGVYGLAEDYKISGAKGRDSFENWLTQTLLKDFGKDAAGQLSIAFYELKEPSPQPSLPSPGVPLTAGAGEGVVLGGGDACVVTVKPSPKPRFVTENGQELFYIRTGNATNQLKPSELLGYCAQRWPQTTGNA